ncbi:SOS response-associated peptidase family protein [Arthrobacter woluwensis]|uniref:hypothetical protein n=1 Tax=Arthrobacter woluwensis TaxID=156980 RepID=UPI003818EC41
MYDAEQDGYVILTMDADLAAGEVHTRQPIFVPDEMRERWLRVGPGETPGKGQPDKHKEVLAELRDFSRTETERLGFYAFSRDFNNVRALGDRVYAPDLIAPSQEMQQLLETEGFDPGLSLRERAAAKKPPTPKSTAT